MLACYRNRERELYIYHAGRTLYPISKPSCRRQCLFAISVIIVRRRGQNKFDKNTSGYYQSVIDHSITDFRIFVNLKVFRETVQLKQRYLNCERSLDILDLFWFVRKVCENKLVFWSRQKITHPRVCVQNILLSSPEQRRTKATVKVTWKYYKQKVIKRSRYYIFEISLLKFCNLPYELN